MEIVTSWVTLMEYAREVGKARQSGDEERLKKAIEKHEDYRRACLNSDRMVLPFTNGSI